MRYTWTLPLLIACVCVTLFGGCPIPFGYYTAGNDPIDLVQTYDNSNAAAVSAVVFRSAPASGGDPVVVSGTSIKSSDQLISLSTATPDAYIYYCAVPGGTPNPYDSHTFLYHAGQTIEVTHGNPVTINAIAFKALMPPSAISTLTMTIEYAQLSVNGLAIDSTGGVFSRISATIANSGANPAANIPYEIVLSDTAALEPGQTYPVIYASTLSVPAGGQTDVSVSMADVANYVAEHAGPPDGKYYLGLVVDPDNTTGDGPFEAARASQSWFVDGALAEFKLSGAISAEAYIATRWGFVQIPDYTLYTYVADGTYTVYYGVIAANNPFVSNTPASVNLTPSQIFLPGWHSVQAAYDTTPNGMSAIPYEIGAPGTGPFVVAAFLDWDNDGLISTDSVPYIVDPIAMAGFDYSGGFVTQTYSQDTSGVDLTFPMAPN